MSAKETSVNCAAGNDCDPRYDVQSFFMAQPTDPSVPRDDKGEDRVVAVSLNSRGVMV